MTNADVSEINVGGNAPQYIRFSHSLYESVCAQIILRQSWSDKIIL